MKTKVLAFLIATPILLTCSVAVILLAAPLILIRAWAFQTLWLWFIAPTFHLQPLRFVEALGICLVVAMMFRAPTVSTEENKRKDKQKYVLEFVGHAVAPVISVALGWIVRHWMV